MPRDNIVLQCQTCKSRNYVTTKNKKTTPDHSSKLQDQNRNESMPRDNIVLQCKDCKSRNYVTTKNKKTTPDRWNSANSVAVAASTLVTKRPSKHCRLPIADCQFRRPVIQIGNWKSAIGNPEGYSVNG